MITPFGTFQDDKENGTQTQHDLAERPEHVIPEDTLGVLDLRMREALNDREYDILVQRFKYEKTLVEVAKVYNVTKERIRQIQVRAIEKVRGACRNVDFSNDV